MHNWSDDKVDWKGLNDAANYIADYLVRYGRVFVTDHKEKWGTVRVYLFWGFQNGWLMNHMFYPQYHYYQFPRWVRKIDSLVPCSWINPILIPYQEMLYKKAYKNAILKWPHLKREILEGSDYPELLKHLE